MSVMGTPVVKFTQEGLENVVPPKFASATDEIGDINAGAEGKSRWAGMMLGKVGVGSKVGNGNDAAD